MYIYTIYIYIYRINLNITYSRLNSQYYIHIFFNCIMNNLLNIGIKKLRNHKF